jgi:hypothetical protein
MRSEEDVREYEVSVSGRWLDCEVCKGRDPKCECRKKVELDIAKYEACIPYDYLHVTSRPVTHNLGVFDEVVLKYCERLGVACKKGYGLILVGDPGSGKTSFLCYVLVRAIELGWRPYYTTFARLDHHLKTGFHDSAAARRLEYMLARSFVVIDDMGKENFKGGDSYFRAQFERILRERYEDRMPTLLATNSSPDSWREVYGDSVESLLCGRFVSATLNPGDMRKSPGAFSEMKEQLGLRG